ncbi:MAG: UvrB/UvrC motif-containing protein [Candidatus Wildermuthbacteria bacterium]|nr:UvrB/UvrC motif-containing protein [Candidatus Wildermuthbacteria bacterium]
MEKFTFLKKKRQEVLPKTAGAYALCANNAILYIGKAANLRDRVKNHFHASSYRDHLFINQITKIGYIETQSDIDALLLESELIKKYQPKYNVMWRDDKSYFYVAITKESLPRVFLAHQPKKLPTTTYQLPTQYIGPFVDGKALKKVLRLLRHVFPYYQGKTHPKTFCGYCHLGICPGPNPDQKTYKQNTKRLTQVLQGKRVSVLKTIEKEMKKAAREERFEKAKELRDQLFALQRVIAHARILNKEKGHENYDSIAKNLQSLLTTRNPVRRIEAYDISNIQGASATGSMVVFFKGMPARDQYRKFKIRIAGTPNDFAMMKELVTRRLKHEEWGYPDLMIIDGGKPQLSAALSALQTTYYQLPVLPVAALAKQHNELFLPNKEKAALLRDLDEGTRNLLLHIRDEAHRFAISYHRVLRRKELIRKP